MSVTVIVPDPPEPFEGRCFTLEAGSEIHRIHHVDYSALQFNPGFGSSRFAPLAGETGPVPTAYAATSLECAIFESLFHDIEPSAPFKAVRWSKIEQLRYSKIRTTRHLQLTSLFSADLMKLQIERTQLIDTPQHTYPRTQRWGQAIHDCASQPDGIVWVSRRYDEEKAMILFNPRVGPHDLDPSCTIDIVSDPECLRIVDDLAHRAGIVLVRP